LIAVKIPFRDFLFSRKIQETGFFLFTNQFKSNYNNIGGFVKIEQLIFSKD